MTRMPGEVLPKARADIDLWLDGFKIEVPPSVAMNQVCNSFKTSGCATATRSSVLAAPVGDLRPCSQS